MNVGSDRVFTRFIPAGAGNTDILSNTDAVIAVYPRWRGEHVFLGLDLLLASGLSPLARGTLIHGATGLLFIRFIPAGAGNTLSIHNCF